MYAIHHKNGKETKKGKELNVEMELKEFEDVLFNKKIIRHKMNRIQSKKYKVGTYEASKISYLVLITKDIFRWWNSHISIFSWRYSQIRRMFS